MARHRYRQHKVKREHTIIEGLLPLLESVGDLAGVQSITPGRINQRSRTGEAGLYFQYKTETGLKLIGRSRTAVQEVFIVTDDPDGVIETLIDQGLVKPGKERPGKTETGKADTGEGETGKRVPGKETSAGEDSGRNRRGRGRVARSNTERNRGPRTGRDTSRRPKPRPQDEHSRTGFAAALGAVTESEAIEAIEATEATQHPGRRAAARGESTRVSIEESTQREPAHRQVIEKVEPKLWNEVLRLHQELLDLEKRLGDEESSPGETHSSVSMD